MINRFFTSLRFVLNDSQLCVMAGVGWGWLAAKLPTNPNQLLKLEIACHSEQSEESQIFYRTTMIFFQKSINLQFCQAYYGALQPITPYNQFSTNITVLCTFHRLLQTNIYKYLGCSAP